MLERSITQKVREAEAQGWHQQLLSRFLKTCFRLARICGLTDITEETTDIPLTEQEKNWSDQVERLINLGFHAELGINEGEYPLTIPAFAPQPPRFKGRFNLPILIDPRVSLQRQLDLHKVKADNNITPADLVRLSMRESAKPHIPKEPYQLWVRVDLRTYQEAYKSGELRLRTIEEFAFDERGLTPIEGLAVLREAPDLLYNGFPDINTDGISLLDSAVGENRVFTLKPMGNTRLPGQVAVLTTGYAGEYTCSYNLTSCAKLPKDQ